MPSRDEDSNAPSRSTLTLEQYVDGVRRGDTAILARALTVIESSAARHLPLAEDLISALMPATGNAIRVGITGAPGVGKSTMIEALGLKLIAGGHRVAVLAIDPSSRVSGGSILGDKTRMPRLATSPAAYIRPSPSAGSVGGAAHRTRESILLCEAAGFDVVLVETVGVGQSEYVVAQMVDHLVALIMPGAGDELQAMKRGMLEVVDVIAVNQADGPSTQAAQQTARQYEGAGSPRVDSGGKGRPPVLTCSALEDRGVDSIWQAVAERHEKLRAGGELEARRRRQNVHWLWAIVEYRLKRFIDADPRIQELRSDLEEQVTNRTLSAAAAARKILEAAGIPT